MILQCPVCSSPVELAPLSGASGSRECPVCRNSFFLAGDLAFCYGQPMPPSATSRHRIACPHCQQHYNLPDPPPQNPLLGCIKCFKIFAIPVLQETNIATQTLTGDMLFPSQTPAGKKVALPEENSVHTPENTPRIRVIPIPEKKKFADLETLPPDVFSSPGGQDSAQKENDKKLPPGLSLRIPSPHEKTTVQTHPENRIFPENAVLIAEGMREIKFSQPQEKMEKPALKVQKKEENIQSMPPPPAHLHEKSKGKKDFSSVSITEPDDAMDAKDANGTKNTEKKEATPKQGMKNSLKIRQYAGNILWLFVLGLANAIIAALYGCLFCITIIGIPLGLQLFKISKLYLFPFGADVREKENSKIGCLATGGNILWIIVGGWIFALCNLIVGGLLFCTVIGIPFALQYFKLAKLVLAPFGKEVRWKGNMKDLLVCIIIVFVLEFVVVPAITSGIRKAVINSITKNVKVIPDGTKNSSSSGKMEESSIDDF